MPTTKKESLLCLKIVPSVLLLPLYEHLGTIYTALLLNPRPLQRNTSHLLTPTHCMPESEIRLGRLSRRVRDRESESGTGHVPRTLLSQAFLIIYLPELELLTWPPIAFSQSDVAGQPCPWGRHSTESSTSCSSVDGVGLVSCHCNNGYIFRLLFPPSLPRAQAACAYLSCKYLVPL